MALGKEIRVQEVQELAFGSIGANYTSIGSAASNPTVIIHIQNLTDALLMFSYDGVIDHFPLAAGAFLLLDVHTNHPVTGGLFISTGTDMHVKEIDTPTSGSVYVTFYYPRNS